MGGHAEEISDLAAMRHRSRHAAGSVNDDYGYICFDSSTLVACSLFKIGDAC